MTVPGIAGLDHGHGFVPYHVGIVVADLERTMSDFEVLGMSWTDIASADSPMWTPDGEVEFHFEFAYSRGEGIVIELIKEVPGTLWVSGRGLHHMGLWSPDLARDAARLEEQGWRAVVGHRQDTGEFDSMSYHQGPEGILYELTSAPLALDHYKSVFR